MPNSGRILRFWYEPAAPAVGHTPTLTEAAVCAAFGADEASHLGSGSFGETWKVRAGRQRSAVKIILDGNYPLDRLEREAEGLSRGASSHVVRLDDVGRIQVGSGTKAYFRFEFVEGGDAAHHIQRGNWPDEPDQIEFCIGILEALGSLHAADVVHRDVKFENVALRGGTWSDPVLLDLGLVRIEDSSSLTLYPALMGTLPFMAPEQIREERARKGSDLWALGVMMYVLGTRHHPFFGNRTSAIGRTEALSRVTAGPPDVSALPTRLQPLVGRWLQPVIHRRGTARTALQKLGQ